MIGLGLAALPQKLLAEVVGFVVETAVVVAITFHYVSAHYELEIKAARADEQQKAAQQYKSEVDKYNDLAQKYEDSKAHTNTVYHEIETRTEQVIHDPVFSNVCLNDNGRMLINSAISGSAPSPAASVASSAMSAASFASR